MSRSPLSVLFALDAILLVLLVIGFQFVEPGTPEYAISQVSFAVIVLTGIGISIAARRNLTFFDY
ncbi:hypothetical protein [Halorussus caseinilyticus]|uniref:Uncharacterized protein n=1 Tax=Halorussus caseinilyticus TaxID=3034025 RepID=A0ABD5WMR4_9EURY|nr:hypothetical protein [Halorussus sp. DT72]